MTLDDITAMKIPDHMRLWFGGNVKPSDWDLSKVWHRDGFIGSLNSSSNSYWHRENEDIDIVGYVSTKKDYDLSHAEQIIVENMSKAAWVEFKMRGDEPWWDLNDLEEVAANDPIVCWPNEVSSHIGAQGFRDSALAAYMIVRPMVKQIIDLGMYPAKWCGDLTVGNFISNLMTMPLEMPIHAAYHATMGDGKTNRLFIKQPTVSKERVDGREIKPHDKTIPQSAVIWSQCRTPGENTKEDES